MDPGEYTGPKKEAVQDLCRLKKTCFAGLTLFLLPGQILST